MERGSMKRLRIKVPYKDHTRYKAAFDAWATTGSLERAAQLLAEKGITSIRGTPYTANGLRLAAMKFMAENYEEAKKTLLKIYEESGYIVDDAFIDRYMIKSTIHAMGSPERSKYWLVKNGLFIKYKGFIDSLMYIPDD